MEQYINFTTGPTKIPNKILKNINILYQHRSKKFKNILEDTTQILQDIYKTKNDIFILTGSGTLAMEASIVNTLNNKSKVIIINAGKFGQRWCDIADSYSIKSFIININVDNIINTDELIKKIDSIIESNNNIDAILMQHCETSTNIITDIKKISQYFKNSNILTISDSITTLGVYKYEVDKWGTDIVIGSSQKAFQSPAGISFLSFSDKAWSKNQKSNLKKFYINLTLYKKQNPPWTPGILNILILNQSLKIYQKTNKIQHVEKIINICIKKLNLELYNPIISKSLTIIKVPPKIYNNKENTIIRIMKEKYNILLSDGQGKLKGKIIRIGYLAYDIKYQDILILLKRLELCLYELNHKFQVGDSIKQFKIEIKNINK